MAGEGFWMQGFCVARARDSTPNRLTAHYFAHRECSLDFLTLRIRSSLLISAAV